MMIPEARRAIAAYERELRVVRICFVSRRFFPAISGMSVYAVNLLRELVRAGHDVTMISQYRGDAFGSAGLRRRPAAARVEGVEDRRARTGGRADERRLRARHRHNGRHHQAPRMRVKPFDILHAQYGYPTGWATLLAARQISVVPAVVSIQGGDGHWVGSCCETHRVAMQTGSRRGRRPADRRRKLHRPKSAERLGTARERFTIVPGAVDTERGSGRPTRRRIGDASAPGAAALPWPRRPAERRTRRPRCARPPAPSAGWRSQATVSGIGPDLDACRERAAALALDASLSSASPAMPITTPCRRSIDRHDVFVSPTYGEGFSNTILEAMASGLANLSCFAVGVNDCLRDDENGLLVEPGDIQRLRPTACNRLIENGDSLRRRHRHGSALEECRRRSIPGTRSGRHHHGGLRPMCCDRLRGGAPVDPVLPVSATAGSGPSRIFCDPKTALALSPHLDDAVFSCGGTLALHGSRRDGAS